MASLPGQGVIADPNDIDQVEREKHGQRAAGGRRPLDLQSTGAVRCEMMPERQARLQSMAPCGSWGNGKPLECCSQGRRRFRLADVMQNKLKRNQSGQRWQD